MSSPEHRGIEGRGLCKRKIAKIREDERDPRIQLDVDGGEEERNCRQKREWEGSFAERDKKNHDAHNWKGGREQPFWSPGEKRGTEIRVGGVPSTCELLFWCGVGGGGRVSLPPKEKTGSSSLESG